MEVTISIDLVILVCTAITLLAGVLGIFWRATKPVRDIGEQINELVRRSERDFKHLQQLDHDIKVIGRATWVLLAHTAEGNHTGRIKEVLEELSVALMGYDDVATKRKEA